MILPSLPEVPLACTTTIRKSRRPTRSRDDNRARRADRPAQRSASMWLSSVPLPVFDHDLAVTEVAVRGARRDAAAMIAAICHGVLIGAPGSRR